MAENEKRVGTVPIVLGKKTKNESFSTITTAEEVQANNALQKEYDDENAVPIESYFSIKGVRDPVAQAMMTAYTKVRHATVAAFDDIFKTY